MPFGSETYSAGTTTNVDFDTEIVRYSYQSLATPASVIDFNMRTKEKEVKKEQQVLGGKFDKNNYIEERVWATATDGTKVPISLVYRKGLKKDGKNIKESQDYVTVILVSLQSAFLFYKVF